MSETQPENGGEQPVEDAPSVLPEQPVMDQPSTRLNPYVEDQNMDIKPTVMGPPAFGSPDPETVNAYLAPVVDHPRVASFSEDYGADVLEDSNLVSGQSGEEVDVEEEIGSEIAAEETDYNAMTVEELKNLSRDRGIEGFSTMNKAELVAANEEYDAGQQQPSSEE